MPWTGTHHAFVVENFTTNGESVTATLRNFRTHFHLSRHDPVPDRKSILLWVKNFRDTGSALKRKPSGRPRSVAFVLQRTSKLLESLFGGLQGALLISILLH